MARELLLVELRNQHALPTDALCHKGCGKGWSTFTQPESTRRRATLTLTRLRIKGQLKRTLESTNPCESMIEIVRS
jgi:hypothetical protein